MTPSPQPSDGEFGAWRLDSSQWSLDNGDGSKCPGYAVFIPEIQKSPADLNSYKLIQLASGVQIILISNPTMSLCAAAAATAVGMVDDPDHVPGLAHLTEHCIMNSLQAPPSRIQAQGTSETGSNFAEYALCYGSSCCNGSIDLDTTVYRFDIPAALFKEALSQWTGIFSPPQMSDEAIGREVLSVHAEYQSKCCQDKERLAYLHDILSRPNARCTRFGDGDYNTLTAFCNDASTLQCPASPAAESHSHIWARLREPIYHLLSSDYWHRQTAIAIVSPEPLDVMTTMASALFSNMNISGGVAPISPQREARFSSPWTQESCGTVVFAQAVEGRRTVTLRWAIPWEGTSNTATPAALLGHVFMAPGLGTLPTTLIDQEMIETFPAVLAGFEEGDICEGYGFFFVNVYLNWDGWCFWQEVIRVVLGYVNLLMEETVDEAYLSQLYDIARRSLDSRQEEPVDMVKHLALTMLRPYDRTKLVTGPMLYTDYSPEQLRTWISEYLQPGLVRVTLSGYDGWENILVPEDDDPWLVAPRFGVTYRVKPLDEFIESEWGAEDRRKYNLRLPSPNPFVAQDFSVFPLDDDSSPSQIVPVITVPGRKVWYKQDDVPSHPEASIRFELRSPLFSTSPADQAMLFMYLDVAHRKWGAIFPSALSAGYTIFFEKNIQFAYLEVIGFHDKLLDIFERYVAALADRDSVDEVFDKHIARLQAHPVPEDSPIENVASPELLGKLLYDHAFTERERFEALKDKVREDVQRFHLHLLDQLDLRLLMCGNVNQQFVLEAYKICRKYLGTANNAPFAAPNLLVPPPGWSYIIDVVQPTRSPGSNHVHIAYHLGWYRDAKTRAMVSLIKQALTETVQDRLIRPYDLGYSIHLDCHAVGGRLWLFVAGQTPHDPAFLERCFDWFMNLIQEGFRVMPAPAFESRKTMLHPPRQPGVSSFRHDMQSLDVGLAYDSGPEPFKSLDVDADLCGSITQEDVTTFMNDRLSPFSAQRSKLSVRFRAEEQVLSTRAVEWVLDNWSYRGITTENMEDVLPPGTLVNDEGALQACEARFSDHVPRTTAAIWTRYAAEMFPHNAPGTLAQFSPYIAPFSRVAFVEDREELRAHIRYFSCPSTFREEAAN